MTNADAFTTTKKLTEVKVTVKGCVPIFVYGKMNTEVFEAIQGLFQNGYEKPQSIPYVGKKRGRKPKVLVDSRPILPQSESISFND